MVVDGTKWLQVILVGSKWLYTLVQIKVFHIFRDSSTKFHPVHQHWFAAALSGPNEKTNKLHIATLAYEINRTIIKQSNKVKFMESFCSYAPCYSHYECVSSIPTVLVAFRFIDIMVTNA